MGIFNFLQRKSTKKSATTLTDDDRRAGLELRRVRADIKKQYELAELEKAKLELFRVREEVAQVRAEYEEDFEDDDVEIPDSPESLLMMLLTKQMMNAQTPHPAQPAPVAPTIQATTAQGRELSEAEMSQLLQGVPPAVRKRLKKLDDAQLEAQIAAVVPDISPNSLEKAKVFIREQ